MNISTDSIHGDINRPPNECSNWNTQCRYTFLPPDKCSSVSSYHIKDWNNGPTSSDYSSARLAKELWLIIDSASEDESATHRTDSTIPRNTFYSKKKLQLQPSVGMLHQPWIYDKQHQIQRSYDFAPLPRETSFRVAPVEERSMPMSSPSSPHDHLMHHAWPKNFEYVPITPEATPSMMSLLSYPEQNNAQVSASVVSSTLSTPVLDSVSTAGYCNTYGYVKTPVGSSASSTPIWGHLNHPDLLPVLDLNSKNLHGSTFPKRISSNIHMVKGKAGCPNAPERTACMPSTTSSHSLINKQKTKPNYFPSGDTVKIIKQKALDNLWSGSCEYDEYLHNRASNLFITWSGSKAKLIDILKRFKLKLRDVCRTKDENIYNVIFESHQMARKAFTRQREIPLRIVPPKNSQLNWFRNPSPKFPVKFEVKSQLVVRNGKAECHEIVGELLEGCMIWADQLKGRRIRVASCEGRFMFPGGKIVEMQELPNMPNENSPLGWITYRCQHTKELLLERRSLNHLSDYILIE